MEHTNTIPCDKHPSKMSCLLCTTCDQLVCPDCAESVHNKHDFSPINEAVNETLDHLKDTKSRIGKDLKLCRSKVKEIKATELKCDSMIDIEISKIKQKEQELKSPISESALELQDKLETERKMTKKILIDAKTDMDKSEKVLIIKESQIEDALASNQRGQILSAAIKFKDPPEDLKLNFKPPEISQFVPSEKLHNTMELLGTFQKTTIPSMLTNIDFQLMKSYTTDLSYIPNLITLDEQTAWISNWNKKVLQKVTVEDDKIWIIQEISQNVYDMTITPNNDILLSLSNSSEIKLLTKSGEIKSFLSVSPLETFGIHVTSDDVIIVGVKEDDRFTYPDNGKHALYIYGKDRKRQKCFEYDTSNMRWDSLPYRITTHTNNDIVVIDLDRSGGAGRVVVIGREGGLKWTYNGHPNINNNVQFDPRDIVTAENHIIVSDFNTHSLHVLSEFGDVLSCQVMEDIGITYPWALDIDRRGQLWVGCHSHGKDTGAKIHIVTLH